MVLFATKFPDLYVKFLSYFSFLNFAIVPRFLRLECEMRVDHYSRVFFMTLGPMLLIALGMVCFGVHLLCTRGENEAKRNQLRASYFSVFLVGTYLIYPSVTTTLFQTLCCEVFDTPEYEGDGTPICILSYDPRLKCGHRDRSDLHRRRRWGTAFIGIRVHVHVVVFGILYRGVPGW